MVINFQKVHLNPLENVMENSRMYMGVINPHLTITQTELQDR